MYFVDERTKQNEEPESLRFPAHRRGAIGFEVGRTASNSIELEHPTKRGNNC